MPAVAEKKTTAGRIKDARGQWVPQLDPVAMHLMHRPGIIPRDTLGDIAEDIGFGTTTAVRIALWSWIVCLVCLAIASAILLARLTNGAITTRRFIVSLVPVVYNGYFGSSRCSPRSPLTVSSSLAVSIGLSKKTSTGK